MVLSTSNHGNNKKKKLQIKRFEFNKSTKLIRKYLVYWLMRSRYSLDIPILPPKLELKCHECPTCHLGDEIDIYQEAWCQCQKHDQ